MDHLLQVAVRSLLLAAIAALSLCRVKSASIRHAVWTLVTASMLLQIPLGSLLPELPLRVLHSAEPRAITITTQVFSVAERRRIPAPLSSGAAIYICGLLFFLSRFILALLFAHKLARASEPAGRGAYQSRRISAPVTIGNRILLPASWSGWDSAKLEAVLAHEEAHVRRRDWAIAVMARLNRCVFWFHPLAWWLERQLARLAEQSCDDEALAVVQDREQYARTLLEMARSIHLSRGRLLAVPMAKEANVETRIDRILDETRRIPQALGRRGWLALALCSVPWIYMAATVQLAPAQTVTALAPPAPPQPPALAQPPAPPQPAASPQPPAPPQPPASPHALATPQTPAPPQPLTPVMIAQTPAPPPPRPPASGPPLQVSVTSIHVGVTSTWITTIRIPLDPSAQYEFNGRITTTGRRFVSSFDELVDYRDAAEKNIALKSGTYRLDVFVKNLNDGKIATQTMSFQVD